MFADWIQFGILLLALLLFALRNERRLTKLEEGLKTDRLLRQLIDRRVAMLERRKI